MDGKHTPRTQRAILGADNYTQFLVSSNGKTHEYYAQLHEKYGNIVRTGKKITPPTPSIVLIVRLRS